MILDRRWYSVLFLFLLSVFVVGVSFRALNAPFILDDQKKIVDNPDIKNLKSLKDRLIYQPSEPLVFTRNDPSRPLIYLSYTLDYWAFELNPLGYRLVNLGLHLGCSVLIFFLLQFCLRTYSLSWLPYFLTAFFALHPISITTMLYVFKRSDLLMTLFYLSASFVFVKQNSPSWWRTLSIGLCFLLALASKQSAVTLPLVLLFTDYFFVSERNLQKLKINRVLHLTLWTLCFIYLLTRYLYFGGLGDLEAQQTWDWQNYLLIQPWITLRYLAHLLLPLYLSVDHDVRAILDWADLRIWISAAFVFVVGVLFFRLFRKRQIWWLFILGALWFAATLAPTSSFFPTTTAMDDNRLYLSMFGFLLMLAGVIQRISDKFEIQNVVRAVAAFCLILIAVSSFSRSRLYAEPLKLWQDVLRQYPESYRAHITVGNEYYKIRDWTRATENYSKAIEANSAKPEPYSNIGNVLFFTGDRVGAAEYFKAALEQDPDFVPALTNLSHIQILNKEFAVAEANLKRVNQIDPGYALAYNNLGILYLEQNRLGLAKDYFFKSLKLDPRNLNTKYNLGLVFAADADKPRALEYFSEVLRAHPQDEDAKIWVKKLAPKSVSN